MEQYLGITALIVMISIIFTVLYAIFNKKSTKNEYVSYVFFNIFLYYCILSIVKMKHGYLHETLFESFWNAELVTYVHYGVPMILIGGIELLIILMIMKKHGLQFMRYFNSSMCLSLIGALFFTRRINNFVYSIAFLVAISITCVSSPFLMKKADIGYVLNKDSIKKVKSILPVLGYWLVTVAIYIPNELYLSNIEDFPMAYGYFFCKIMLTSVSILVICTFAIWLFCCDIHMEILKVCLFIMVTIGYLQGMLLNGEMKSLDGEIQSWTTNKMISNLCIWGALILVSIVLYKWKKQIANKVIVILSLWLIATQLVSLGVLVVTTPEVRQNKETLELTTEGMLEIGEDNNIFVFVLDKFDGTIMDDLLESQPDLLDELTDFTYYPNATSEFCPTQNSLPFLITGTEYNEETTQQYIEYAYEKDDYLLKQLVEKGYRVDLYTHTRYVPENVKDYVANYKDEIKRRCDSGKLIRLMMQCSRYRLAPFAFKNYYQYDSTDIALLVVDDQITNIENDIPFYQRISNKGLTMSGLQDGQDNRYKLFHMHGAHPPFIMSNDFQYYSYDERRDNGYGVSLESQAEGSLKVVYAYLNQLKVLGKYDDSMIIITADHGFTSGVLGKNGEVCKTSFPILFVKEPYALNENHEMVINHAPVAHKDLIGTIKDYIEVAREGDSKLSDFYEGDNRIRYLKEGSNEHFLKFEIDGEVRDWNNWRLISSTEAE